MERLTQWTPNGASLILGEPKNDIEARQILMKQFKKACNKLAELEDKIESGKLIDTTEYFAQSERLPNGKVRYLVCKHDYSVGIYDFKDTLEQAEARLQELKEQNNG